jgi:hypothetical protein
MGDVSAAKVGEFVRTVEPLPDSPGLPANPQPRSRVRVSISH